jgi:hypothetical protein
MNFTSIEESSSLILACQETLFHTTSGIELEGYLSITTWVGLALIGITVLGIYFCDDNYGGGYVWLRHVFYGIGIVGIIGGIVGALGNVIISAIVLGNCKEDAGYAFFPSICFQVSIVTIFVGAIPSIILLICFQDKEDKALIAVLATTGFIAGISHIIGNIGSFYLLSQ